MMLRRARACTDRYCVNGCNRVRIARSMMWFGTATRRLQQPASPEELERERKLREDVLHTFKSFRGAAAPSSATAAGGIPINPSQIFAQQLSPFFTPVRHARMVRAAVFATFLLMLISSRRRDPVKDGIPLWALSADDKARFLLMKLLMNPARQNYLRERFVEARRVDPSLTFARFLDSTDPNWCATRKLPASVVLLRVTELVSTHSEMSLLRLVSRTLGKALIEKDRRRLLDGLIDSAPTSGVAAAMPFVPIPAVFQQVQVPPAPVARTSSGSVPFS